MTEERLLRRDEIPLVWEIDRSEVIEHLYSVEAGQLVLRPEFYDSAAGRRARPSTTRRSCSTASTAAAGSSACSTRAA